MNPFYVIAPWKVGLKFLAKIRNIVPPVAAPRAQIYDNDWHSGILIGLLHNARSKRLWISKMENNKKKTSLAYNKLQKCQNTIDM